MSTYRAQTNAPLPEYELQVAALGGGGDPHAADAEAVFDGGEVPYVLEDVS